MSEPPSDSFHSLLRSDLCVSTDAFLSVYREGISRSLDPVAALTRFMVGPMTVNKGKKAVLESEHELVSFKVDDCQTYVAYDFFIERNASKPQMLPASTCPLGSLPATVSIGSTSAAGSTAIASTSYTVALESIERVAHHQTSGQQMATTTPPEAHPLLPLNETLTSSVPLTPTSSVSHHLPSMQSNASQHSFREKFTLASAQTLRSSATSLTSVAEDRILGRGKFVTDSQAFEGILVAGEPIREIGRVVRQIKPKDLSFYELGLIVDTVHEEAPDYHLLNNQCYWFVTTIIIIIVLLYGDTLNPVEPTRKSPNDYLPNLAGRWKNMLIVAPEDEIIRRIVIKFMERREEAFSEVRFSLIFIQVCSFLKSRKGKKGT